MQRAPAWAGECRARRPQPRDREAERGQAGSTSLNQAQGRTHTTLDRMTFGDRPRATGTSGRKQPQQPKSSPTSRAASPRAQNPPSGPEHPFVGSTTLSCLPSNGHRPRDIGAGTEGRGNACAATCDRSWCSFPRGTHEMETGGMRSRDVLGISIHNQGRGRRRSRPGVKVRGHTHRRGPYRKLGGGASPGSRREWG